MKIKPKNSETKESGFLAGNPEAYKKFNLKLKKHFKNEASRKKNTFKHVKHLEGSVNMINVNKIMCSTIPCIFIALYFSQIEVNLSLICALNLVSYFYKSSGHNLQSFCLLGCLILREILPKHWQNKRFPPSCCFGFATSGLSRIDY